MPALPLMWDSAVIRVLWLLLSCLQSDGKHKPWRPSSPASRLAGTGLLCSSALVHRAALAGPVQTGIRLHVGGICKICLLF